MRIIPNVVWTSMLETVRRLEARILHLEAENSALIDRLLLEKGHLPIDVGLQKAVIAETQEQEDLMATLLEEERGEYTRDEAAPDEKVVP